MQSIIGVMQKVAAHEVRRIYTTELGEVTAVFPHVAEDDTDNYQCSVKLKNRQQPDGEDFELSRVPVATQHLGLVNIPNVGDLVLVSFIGGNLNAPVIMGRLYNDQDLPPVNNEQEVLLQHSLTAGGSFKIDAEGAVTITSKNEQNIVTVADDTDITLVNATCQITIKEGDITLANDQCTITVKGGNVTLDNGTCKVAIEGSGITLDAASNTVTIKGMGGITLDAASNTVTIKGMGGITIGDSTTLAVQVGGRVPGQPPVADNDNLIMSMHTHVGNLGIPCPVMVPMETVNSIQAKLRNTTVG
jgi:phage baseplate assembly protein gpV